MYVRLVIYTKDRAFCRIIAKGPLLLFFGSRRNNDPIVKHGHLGFCRPYACNPEKRAPCQQSIKRRSIAECDRHLGVKPIESEFLLHYSNFDYATHPPQVLSIADFETNTNDVLPFTEDTEGFLNAAAYDSAINRIKAPKKIMA